MAAATRQRSISRPAAMAREQALSRISGGKSSAFWQQLTPMPTIAQSTPPAAFSPISVRIPANFCFPQTRSFVHLMPGRSRRRIPPPAHSGCDGAGQVHQLLRRTLWAQKDAHINSHPRRGQKRPSHPSPAAGLAIGDQDGAVGSALRSKHFQSIIGGIQLGKYEKPIFPRIFRGKERENLLFHVSQCRSALPRAGCPEFRGGRECGGNA